MEPEGRYASLPIRSRRLPSGVTVRYRARRFLLQPGSFAAKRVAAMTESDRVDLLAARHLGSPLVWWWICDANHGMSPTDLEREPGRPIRIPDDAPHHVP